MNNILIIITILFITKKFQWHFKYKIVTWVLRGKGENIFVMLFFCTVDIYIDLNKI